MVATLNEVLADARRSLRLAGCVETPDLDARLLVEHFTGTTRLDAISRPGMPVDPAIEARVTEALARRAAGEPVHRIIGRRGFYGLDLALGPDTLEPRPDTETLVDAALSYAQAAVRRSGACRILDLGTGTGAIALAMLSAVPEATATGSDRSPGALEVAARNVRTLGFQERFSAVLSDWFERIDGVYDVILSNPPYIRSATVERLSQEVKAYDPMLALDGGADGLVAYRAIAAGAHRHLRADGLVAVEIGYDQRDEVADLFGKAGYRPVFARKDIGGNDRALGFAVAG